MDTKMTSKDTKNLFALLIACFVVWCFVTFVRFEWHP